MGDADAIEAPLGSGDVEDGVVETIRDQPPDDPQLDRDLDDGRTKHGPRSRRNHKPDPGKEIIDTRLAQHPKLSVRRLFDEARTP